MKKCRKILSLLCPLILICSVFSMTASAASPEVDWLIPKRLKVGDSVSVIANGKNLPTGIFAASISDSTNLGNFFNHCFSNHAYGPDEVGSDGTARLIVGSHNSRMMIMKPGTLVIQALVDNGAINSIGSPYTVTIEEPVVKSNLPQTITVGEKLTFSADLTNTSLANEKVSTYDKPKSDFHQVAYQPTIEIIEGKDVITIGSSDCSTILNAKADLIFNKEGTSKIKVKFNQIQTCSDHFGDEGTYSPEKTFTIQVKNKTNTTSSNKPTDLPSTTTPSSATTSKPVSTSESTETSGTSTAPSLTESVSQPSLIDTETHISITGNVPNNAILSVKPISENEDTYTTIKEKLSEQVSRFQSYDINLLDSENATIQPDGSVQVCIPKPEGFGDNLAVYRTEADGSMTLLDSEVMDGHVVFTTEHFSLYTIAELADVPAVTPPSSGIPTGGIVAIVIGVLALVGGGVTAGILLYRKKKAAPSDLT